MIIGLSGYAGSGKTTIAAEIVKFGYRRRKFAAPLKNMIRALLASQRVGTEEIERMIEGDLKERPSPHLNGATPRHAMQTIGTEWGRELICPNLWVDAAMRGAEGQDIVFDDVRFTNEADAIRGAGGIVVRLHRTGVGVVGDHPSEVLPWAEMDVANNKLPLHAARMILKTIR